MALESTTLSSLLLIDRTCADQLSLRRSLIANRRAEVLGLTTQSHTAVYELYSWLTNTYLPTRYPTLFTLHAQEDQLLNAVTNDAMPLHPASAESALAHLGAHVDTDFLLLLPSPSPTANGEKDVKYHLTAFITCFPNGFSTASKLGLSLTDIHGPVPGYKVKLERSMDRYFAGLPVGKVVRRGNWAVSTDGVWCCAVAGHGAGVEYEEVRRDGGEDVDLGRCRLRCERQTLHRLPGCGAVYTLKEVRDEGSGEALAEAIDGLERGSVPGIAVYKRKVVWGEKVKAYLRGEIDG
ncbi:hypothetical protein P153DRAFT_332402 [Dothidotthia symphoricarpi CBS 119687]|uniref:Uncharacterized protein n=1 Tax=Dothidotthia symphoricarpi CBS 119687 TaxID=1392245 RepID=A0A6A6AQP1_9PLEO|nr:uncharacterized protein P153DRAFT_332402 [Dothidotthia symphoricarpi CBS 119687]KAF2133523.1 hypothetical protein P153DRAFT_332402 [Dothidotthia symphoricarpi CBS 119687]